tara:strand:- start:1015 stop:1308 length:294 start_codon:yes stop_codon:yes gene_type:complete
MPTRRRSSAVKTSTTVAKSPTKSTTTPRKRVNKVTRTKKVAVTEVKQVPQVETPKTQVESPKLKSILEDYPRDGFALILLPLLLLEAGVKELIKTVQ